MTYTVPTIKKKNDTEFLPESLDNPLVEAVCDLRRLGLTFREILNQSGVNVGFLTRVYEFLDIPITNAPKKEPILGPLGNEKWLNNLVIDVSSDEDEEYDEKREREKAASSKLNDLDDELKKIRSKIAAYEAKKLQVATTVEKMKITSLKTPLPSLDDVHAEKLMKNMSPALEDISSAKQIVSRTDSPILEDLHIDHLIQELGKEIEKETEEYTSLENQMILKKSYIHDLKSRLADFEGQRETASNIKHNNNISLMEEDKEDIAEEYNVADLVEDYNVLGTFSSKVDPLKFNDNEQKAANNETDNMELQDEDGSGDYLRDDRNGLEDMNSDSDCFNNNNTQLKISNGSLESEIEGFSRQVVEANSNNDDSEIEDEFEHAQFVGDGEEEDFFKYKSPLACFKSFRFSPWFDQEKILSPTFSNKIDPEAILCFRDPCTCDNLHYYNCEMNETEVIIDLAKSGVVGETSEERENYKRQLAELLRKNQDRSFQEIVSMIVNFRRNFLPTDSYLYWNDMNRKRKRIKKNLQEQ
ncbi:hypothetical protein PACTADRAFT_51481 [Pachysolen tannophilus NRRL Y-2460]|uniref:Uncharacterized protein n=1 Tax=Pachysolen tannophilus NRRL Y-2460 TaxID=669874 RepID=A0A1E4TPP0_PACTA|nr:hypothetical protein PACTADRAFT_51481 [Pachysolen tannophilus NRRL Y-2460]